MRRLETTWIRVIASLFAGGILAESIILLTWDDPNSLQSIHTGMQLLFAVIIYFVLTWYVNRFVKNTAPPL